MDWMFGSMRPGKVLKVVDNMGTIKASCAGMFSEDDDPELLPPVAPWPTVSRTAFTAPHEEDRIWVISFSNNPLELYYVYQRVEDDNSELENGYKDAEIIMKRTDPDDRNKVTAEASYNSDDGFRIKNGSDKQTEFQIDNEDDHDIHFKHSSGTSVSIQKDKISLGSDGGSQYSAVCGEPLVDALNNICNAIDTILQQCNLPHAAPLKAAAAQLQIAKQSISKDNILSKKVTLDK